MFFVIFPINLLILAKLINLKSSILYINLGVYLKLQQI